MRKGAKYLSDVKPNAKTVAPTAEERGARWEGVTAETHGSWMATVVELMRGGLGWGAAMDKANQIEKERGQ